MTLKELLNSDLATISALCGAGVRWWIDTLAELLPGSRAGSIDPAKVLYADADGAVSPGGARANAVVAVPAAKVLTRVVTTPARSRSDAVAIVTFDLSRHFPLPAAQIVAAIGTPFGDMNDKAGLSVPAAALHRDYGARLAAALASVDVAPARVMVANDDGGIDARFDFLPALAEAGLIARRPSSAGTWWGIALFLVTLNVGILIWRDVAQTNALATLVAEQAPAATVAKTIVRRIARTDRLVAGAASRRNAAPALTMLAASTRAVPDGAWVQRLNWSGNTLRLAGYRTAGTNIGAALKREPHFRRVRNAASESLAPGSNGTPFDVVIDLAP